MLVMEILRVKLPLGCLVACNVIKDQRVQCLSHNLAGRDRKTCQIGDSSER